MFPAYKIINSTKEEYWCQESILCSYYTGSWRKCLVHLWNALIHSATALWYKSLIHKTQCPCIHVWLFNRYPSKALKDNEANQLDQLGNISIHTYTNTHIALHILTKGLIKILYCNTFKESGQTSYKDHSHRSTQFRQVPKKIYFPSLLSTKHARV